MVSTVFTSFPVGIVFIETPQPVHSHVHSIGVELSCLTSTAIMGSGI